MLEQAVAEVVKTTPNVRLLDAGVIILVIKAISEIAIKAIRGWQAKNQALSAKSAADLEEAKTLGIAMTHGHNGEQKPSIVAFCPAHIDMVKQITTIERDMKHLADSVDEIKIDVKVIRTAIATTPNRKGGAA